MSSEWQSIKDIFNEALELKAAERENFVREKCRDHPERLDELLSLLQAHEQEGPLDRPIQSIKKSVFTDEMPGQMSDKKIGPYRIIRELGRGGMGMVYLAERDDDQFNQKVALKLIPAGITSENQNLRFLAERQILSNLDHRNIAKLLDGGITNNNLPWFAMEFISGKPIDVYCDEKQLSISQRLKLFTEVCSAIQYAHQKLVIHRDLKPSNILVTEDGLVKLLDFGIAKTLNPDELLDHRAPITKTGLLPLTPAYASPEQIRNDNITTASDIYQLGVILYELLTGYRPYEVSGHSPSEIEQIVCHREPTRPSTAITKFQTLQKETEQTAEEISIARQTRPEQLQKYLRGDLDTIILKALQKDPERRYESAEKMASDISNYLNGQPVSAHPDSVLYRSQKFMKRHTLGVASTFAIILLLMGYAVTITWHSQQTEAALQQAQQENLKAEQVTGFLMEMFEASDPNEFPGLAVTAGDILERGVQNAERLEDQPEIQAQMFDLTGRIYMNLGQYEVAESLLKRGLDLRQVIYDPGHAEISESLHNVGVLYWNRGQYHTAEEFLREALQLKQEIYTGNNESLATTMTALAIVLKELRNFDEAEPLYRDALAMNLELFGEIHESVAFSLNNLGNYLESIGEYQQAEEHYQKSLDIYRELYGNNHPLVAGRLNNLGGLQSINGDLREAMRYHEEALNIRQSIFNDMHPDVAESYHNLGEVFMDLERYEEAEEYLGKALSIRRAVLDSAHPNTSQTVNVLGILKSRTGDYEAATKYYQESLEMKKEQLGEDHSEVGIQLNNIGLLLVRQERYSEAMETLQRSKEIMDIHYDDDHPLQSYPTLGMGHIYMRTDDPERAEFYFREALRIQEITSEADNWLIGDIKSILGSSLSRQGKYEEAEVFLLEGYESLDQQFGNDHARTQSALERVIELYQQWDKPEELHAYQDYLNE